MSKDGHLHALHSFHELRERYGGEEAFKEPETWVFPTDGENGGHGFGEDYLTLLAGAKKKAERPFDSTLLFGIGAKDNAKTGQEAESLYFSYFEFVSDFFSHPQNVGALGLLTRKFISRYSGDGILDRLESSKIKELEKIEEGLVEENGGNHAAMTDTLRLLYNRSIAIAVGTGNGKEVGAVDLGPGGQRLTPIGLPGILDARLRMEEISMTRGGQSFCVDSLSGKVFKRGAWTAQEWEEARIRMQAEQGVGEHEVHARMKHADGFYFQEKVTHLLGGSFNMLKCLRDAAVLHCEEKAPFSLEKFMGRLHHSKKRGGKEERYNDYPDMGEIDYEVLPDEMDLEGAESGKGVQLALPGPNGEGRRKVVKSESEKKLERFEKLFGKITPGDKDVLKNVFERKTNFMATDFNPERGGFCRGAEGPIGTISGLAEWERQAAKARDRKEAEFLVGNLIESNKKGKCSFVVAYHGGVLEGHRDEGRVVINDVSLQSDKFSARKGGVVLETSKGCYKVRGVREISRIPFSREDGIKPERVRLRKGGGILSTIKDFLKGGREP